MKDAHYGLKGEDNENFEEKIDEDKSTNSFNVELNRHQCEVRMVLKVYPYPVTVPLAQLAVGTVLVILTWMTNLYKRPKISGAQLASILPLAVVHTLGNLFTNTSLGKFVVSFTHTIKAMEPFFSVVLSAMFLGEVAN
ncbi:unnamed protein product [Fraxinus pennsylvanica]|uniref:Sugar phosphate transporter domain-containing protein n=1 Tax=Fraxinus pennsylvanica TaxID=56036 RepID=A0AAD1YWS0_9LAMI|nr:unnamed protein product [Fraxinus pennsylvanica]